MQGIGLFIKAISLTILYITAIAALSLTIMSYSDVQIKPVEFDLPVGEILRKRIDPKVVQLITEEKARVRIDLQTIAKNNQRKLIFATVVSGASIFFSGGGIFNGVYMIGILNTVTGVLLYWAHRQAYISDANKTALVLIISGLVMVLIPKLFAARDDDTDER